MHACVHVITREKPDWKKIEEIMAPFNERTFYDQFAIDESDDRIIPMGAYPRFLWDYWDAYDYASMDPKQIRDFGPENVKDCYAMVLPNGMAVSREHWNGKEHLDHPGEVEYAARFAYQHQDYWITRLDIHW